MLNTSNSLTQPVADWGNLPQEILLRIFRYLSPLIDTKETKIRLTLVNAALVCQWWKKAAYAAAFDTIVIPRSIQIYAGGTSTFLLTESSQVYVYGANDNGQLGLGDFNNRNTFTLLPLPENEYVKTIAGGFFHTFILMESGNVYASGSNKYGQLGLGDIENRHQLTMLSLPENERV